MASVKQSWIRKYGEEEGLRKFNEFKKQYGRPKEKFIEEHGIDAWNKYVLSKKTYSLEICVEKYGEIEGPKKWEERKNKKINSQKDNFKDKTWNNGRTLDSYQNRYGIEKGYKLWKLRNERQSYRFSKQYYLDTFGEIEGSKKYKEYLLSMDKTSKAAFVKKYGKVEGTKKYLELNKHKAYCNSIEYYIEKYSEEVGKIKYKEHIRKITPRGISKIPQELFWNIYKLLTTEQQEICRFGNLNSEEIIYLDEIYRKRMNQTCIKIDFKVGNKIIEYDCNRWHNSDKDNLRDEFLLNRNYKILRIDDSIYSKKENKENIIKQCIRFINE